ncbi:hypothetical protein BH10PSE14_BH10PSE14_06180 [soil metagenome]
MSRHLPASLPGHWNTPGGADMAERSLRIGRADLCKGDVCDLELANAVFLAGRNDLDLIVWQTAAKERIRWLSAHLAAAAMPDASSIDEVAAVKTKAADLVRRHAARLGMDVFGAEQLAKAIEAITTEVLE